MAEILIQILIVIFSVLLLGGIIWTLFWRNPRKLSSRRLAAIDAANARRHDAPADRVDPTSADIINLSKASASETNMHANKVSADRADLKGAYAVKRLSVRPFLFRLERFFISCESLWFDQNFIYVFDGQKLAARYKFEQILMLEVTKIRINHARIWLICFADGASELERSSADRSEQDGEREYKFVPAASIFEPSFKEFLQILREKNRGAIKTEPRFWETV